MNSIYFLPDSGNEKFDDFNRNIKSTISNYTQIVSFGLEQKSEYYPENFKLNIPEILFIPTIFDFKNSMGYQGVEFAMRWYFHLILKNHCNFEIVLLGIEDKAAFFQHCIYSSFLKCPNVSYLQNDSDNIKKHLQKGFKNQIIRNEAIDKINLINLKAPISYNNHHSIANEWALVRYFSMFQIEEKNEKYISLKNKISELDYIKSLHFKYSEVKSLREKFNPKKHFYNPVLNIKEQLKIGIIDDEFDKGWLAFYDFIFDKSKAEVIPFKYFDSRIDKEILIEKIQTWIHENYLNINIFIIDLRLHPDDFSENVFSKLTGIQIIKYLKKTNPGIQIVVSTASNKIWNFQECIKYGVNNFAIKESPETFNTREETKELLGHLNDEISAAAKRIFLADLFQIIDALKKDNIFGPSLENEFNLLVFSKNGLLDQIFNLLLLKSDEESILNQCLLICFQILENYLDLKSIGNFGSNKFDSLNSGVVFLRDNTIKDIYCSKPTEYLTLFDIKFGFNQYQKSESRPTPISFEVFNELTLKTKLKSGVENTLITKLISVLYFREKISISEIEKLLELRYYRSNVSAHYTGNLKTNFNKITYEEIVLFFNLFQKIFKK
jgi:hypothetical protein